MRASVLNCLISKPKRDKLSLLFFACRGMLISALGAFLYSCTGLLTKVVCTAGMPVLNLLLFRFAVQSVLCVGICQYKSLNPFRYLNPKTSLAHFLIARGIIAVACHALFYIGLSRLPLGDAASLGLTSTIWAAFLGSIVQKEGLGWLWLMVLVCSAGILLIAKPGVLNEKLGGDTTIVESSGDEQGIVESLTKGAAIVILIVGAFLHGVSFVLGRHVATRGPPVLSILLMMFFGLFSFIPIVLTVSPFQTSHFTQLDPEQWAALCVIPFVGLGAQLCLISALEFESAATIAIIQNLDAVFSYCFQLLLREGFNIASLCGASLIVFSAAVLAFFTVRKGIRKDRAAAAEAVAAAAAAAAAASQEAHAAAAAAAETAAAGATAAENESTHDMPIQIATEEPAEDKAPPHSSSICSSSSNINGSSSSNRKSSRKPADIPAAANTAATTVASDTERSSVALANLKPQTLKRGIV